MMIALAECLIEHGRVAPDALARAFRDAYDPRRGYGGGTRAVIEMWKAGAAVGEAAGLVFGGEGSRGNGAAMRIAPIAVRFADDPGRLIAEAAASATVTHAHPVAVDAAAIQAAAIGAALRGEDILSAALGAAETDELAGALRQGERLLAGPPDADEVRAQLGSSSDAARSVPTAIYAALSHGSVEQALGFAIGLGGDTDTVAAMAGAIAGARDGVGAIPQRWLDALEDNSVARSSFGHQCPNPPNHGRSARQTTDDA
jgi:poly(ADP-ribose) glycohydrolase ARH3